MAQNVYNKHIEIRTLLYDHSYRSPGWNIWTWKRSTYITVLWWFSFLSLTPQNLTLLKEYNNADGRHGNNQCTTECAPGCSRASHSFFPSLALSHRLSRSLFFVFLPLVDYNYCWIHWHHYDSKSLQGTWLLLFIKHVCSEVSQAVSGTNNDILYSWIALDPY